MKTSASTFSTERHPSKVVYFATGTLAEVSADFSRLELRGNGTRVRVVAPADFSARLAQISSIRSEEIVAYRPWAGALLWLRLMAFLRFSRDAEILCLTSPQRFRLLKFLALTLRGRVVFSPINGARVPLGFFDLLTIWIRQRNDLREERRKNLPIGIVGSASGYYLAKIVPAVRRRYPQAPVHGLLLPVATRETAALFDSVHILEPGLAGAVRQMFRLVGLRKNYQRWVVPCTNEPYTFLKLAAFCWLLPRRQIYNELSDGFAARDVRMLWRHCRWRLRDRMSFQIVSGTAALNLPMRLLHLGLYAVRLFSAVPLLVAARLRAIGKGTECRPGTEGAPHEKSKLEERLARRGVVSSSLPGEPHGPVGLK